MLRIMRCLLFATCFLVWFNASSVSAQILNSERIEQTFGNYGIDVLYSDESMRLSSLYSGPNGARVTRTFAIVEYPKVVAAAFAPEHRQILAGGSIGATFKDSGWEVIKLNMAFLELDAGTDLGRLMRIDPAATLASHLYRLEVERNSEHYLYATIVEIHHPDYLNYSDLRAIYPLNAANDSAIERVSLELIGDGRRKLAELDLSLSE
jgi:hypothetical protein